MKTITLLAVMAILLVELSGAMSASSVGGALTIMMVFLLAAVAVGLYDARLNKRGPLGWIVNIVASVIGGFLAAGLASTVMERILTFLHFEGSLAASRHPLFYISSAGMMILTVLGSWLALQLVNRFRDRTSAGGSGL